MTPQGFDHLPLLKVHNVFHSSARRFLRSKQIIVICSRFQVADGPKYLFRSTSSKRKKSFQNTYFIVSKTRDAYYS